MSENPYKPPQSPATTLSGLTANLQRFARLYRHTIEGLLVCGFVAVMAELLMAIWPDAEFVAVIVVVVSLSAAAAVNICGIVLGVILWRSIGIARPGVIIHVTSFCLIVYGVVDFVRFLLK